ncbi:MAG TPA: hypothetical protein VH859_05420 [Candidatus Limnocylindria bacterium]|jgi:hypothetical protein
MAQLRNGAVCRVMFGALLAGGLTLAACVPATDLPETCDEASVTIPATLVEERLEPSTLEVCRGQQVTIDLTVERDAIFHLHGYDEEVPAQEVRAGGDVSITFEASRAGQFPIEIHTTDGPAAAQVGTLVVHEG